MKRVDRFACVIGIVVLGVFGFTLSGWAQPPEPEMPARPMGQLPRKMEQPGFEPGGSEGEDIRIHWERLELSPEQREQIQQKRREFQINVAAIHQELEFIEQDLRAEMLKDPVAKAKIDSLLQRKSQLRQQISNAALQNLLAIKALLTPEQVEKLAELQSPLPAELRRIQLTPEQRAQIQNLIKDARQKSKAIAGDLQDLRTELREILLTTTEVDMAHLQQLQTAITEKDLALEKERIELLLEIRALLTPEQLMQSQQGEREQKFPFFPGQKK